jgi:hypothetical protein
MVGPLMIYQLVHFFSEIAMLNIGYEIIVDEIAFIELIRCPRAKN